MFPNIISLIRPTFFLFFYVHSKDVAKHLAKSDDVAKFMDTATTKAMAITKPGEKNI